MYLHPYWLEPTFLSHHSLFGIGAAFLLLSIIGAFGIWSLAWKGIALWYAARNGQKWWFIALLVINTLGVLEIVYIVWFRKAMPESTTLSLFSTPPAAAPAEKSE